MGFFERLESIPSQYRWAMIPCIMVLMGAAFWYFVYQPQNDKIVRLEQQIASKRQTLRKHRNIAENYEEFRANVEDLEDQLKLLLVQLPKGREIPDLIRQISDLGVRTGLQISLLRPQAERPKEFYAEVPITVKVVGDYHAVGQFFDALGRLPRIVSVSKVQMARKTESLETQCVATTFRFFESDEGPASNGASANRSKRTK